MLLTLITFLLIIHPDKTNLWVRIVSFAVSFEIPSLLKLLAEKEKVNSWN